MTAENRVAASPDAELWLFGAGGHAKVVIGTARAAGWRVGGLIDPRFLTEPAYLLGATVHPGIEVLPRDAALLVAIGDSRIRRNVVEQTPSERWATLIHPKADAADDVQIGAGTVVFSMAVVQPGSSVGRHVIINTAAVVEHDNQLADYAQLATGARLTGGVTIGTGAFIGAGAVVLPEVKIGDWCIVGAGAVVTRDVPDGTTVIGVPAKEIKPLKGP